jgi:hypothetical protein
LTSLLFPANRPFVIKPVPQSVAVREHCLERCQARRRTAVWLKPLLVCAVRFVEWTDGVHLRAPVFQGWCEDVEAVKIVDEDRV